MFHGLGHLHLLYPRKQRKFLLRPYKRPPIVGLLPSLEIFMKAEATTARPVLEQPENLGDCRRPAGGTATPSIRRRRTSAALRRRTRTPAPWSPSLGDGRVGPLFVLKHRRDHRRQIADEARQMILRQPISQVRWQQQAAATPARARTDDTSWPSPPHCPARRWRSSPPRNGRPKPRTPQRLTRAARVGACDSAARTICESSSVLETGRSDRTAARSCGSIEIFSLVFWMFPRLRWSFSCRYVL